MFLTQDPTKLEFASRSNTSRFSLESNPRVCGISTAAAITDEQKQEILNSCPVSESEQSNPVAIGLSADQLYIADLIGTLTYRGVKLLLVVCPEDFELYGTQLNRSRPSYDYLAHYVLIKNKVHPEPDHYFAFMINDVNNIIDTYYAEKFGNLCFGNFNQYNTMEDFFKACLEQAKRWPSGINIPPYKQTGIQIWDDIYFPYLNKRYGFEYPAGSLGNINNFSIKEAINDDVINFLYIYHKRDEYEVFHFDVETKHGLWRYDLYMSMSHELLEHLNTEPLYHLRIKQSPELRCELRFAVEIPTWALKFIRKYKLSAYI